MENFDVIVLGGGAAGLMCAAAAGRRGRRVLVLEGSNKVGKKILMSGGGRCNFTNLNSQPSNFLSANPHFCKSALSRYTPFDFLALVKSHNIPWLEKTAGQLFCETSSKDILGMLLADCDNVGVKIVTHCLTDKVAHADSFSVHSDKGLFECGSLVIATGGLSIPKMGASDLGYRLARQFDIKVLDTRAGLVPFTFSGTANEMFSRLSGVSLPARLSTSGMSFTDDILFTHRGLSGPAALQLSSYWVPGQAITVDLLPNTSLSEFLARTKTSKSKSLLRSALAGILPRALVVELQQVTWPDEAGTAIGEIGNERLAQIADRLHMWTLKPSGTEGYRTAEVTLGGVDTGELSSRTMESKRAPGLYCVGEVVDVTGHLGGHNFQWAWASAQAAGAVV